MIRLVSQSRIERLTADAEDARAEAMEVREQADTAFSEHIRSLYAATARAESAEQEISVLRADMRMLQVALEAAAADLDDARDDLADARTELAARARQIEALQAPPDTVPVLLLHYGQPHSLHRDDAAARAFAATHGAPLNTWVPEDKLPSAASRWVTVPFIFDVGQDYFVSVVAPPVSALEAAG
ncbi:hypothetical protein ACFYVL_35240 [Streptomyces sp. NPDC004111]|uniref:hypothetical protein n=1 Tax=Streptomyces sp. NPDC004111 TaxID=3364690 RepID=UPI0036A348AD